MGGWKRKSIGELTVHQASTISWLPRVVQAFTTRGGGVSYGSYESLNMSSSVGDAPKCVAENRRRVVAAVAGSAFTVVAPEQVHGDTVALIDEASAGEAIQADALITGIPNILLMMYFADCVPVYLCDPRRSAIGLVHAGWRGAAKNIAGKAVESMRQQLGVEPWTLLAAIGPSISAANYEVGKDVVDEIWDAIPMGASQAVVPRSDLAGTYLLNLRMIVFAQLQAAGLDPDNIAVSDECTFANRKEFFSHRRDGRSGQAVGRMAAVFGMRAAYL